MEHREQTALKAQQVQELKAQLALTAHKEQQEQPVPKVPTDYKVFKALAELKAHRVYLEVKA